MTDTAKADALHWDPILTIAKYDDGEAYEYARNEGLPLPAPDTVETFDGNLLLNAGITRLLDKLIGNAGQVFDATHCRIGVGDSNTAAAASQTDLQAATNKQWVLVDSVSVSAQTLTAVATFTTGLANFAWQEWGIDDGTANGTTVTAPMLNRKVASMGTKASGATWVLTVTIVVS